jgi:acyl-CoA synthetase (AMP-forming)/AMP-acid ligase II
VARRLPEPLAAIAPLRKVRRRCPEPEEVDAMAGLPPIDERTMRATYERVLARRPDELAQTDADGSFTFSGSYSRAVIVARDGQPIDPAGLTAFLIDRLPYFMVPRYLEFADALPKTPTQKVHKHLLRERGTGPQVWDREAAGIVLRRGTVQRGTVRRGTVQQ